MEKTKNEQIRSEIDKNLKIEIQEKYLDILMFRINENRKSMGFLTIIMWLLFLAFPLLILNKITIISFESFTLKDNNFAILLIPSLFAFYHYKYILIWVDLAEQKNTYKNLTSKIFSIDQKTYLHTRLRAFSLTDSIEYLQTKKITPLGCLNDLIYLPIILSLVFLPYIFEAYTANYLYNKYGIGLKLQTVFIVFPVMVGICTILIFFKVASKKHTEI